MEAARLTATIDADSKEGEEGLKRFHGLLGNATEGFKGLLATAGGFALGGGILAGFGALTGFLSDAVKEGKDANEGIAQTEAVIKSTGGAAGVSATYVDQLANGFMNLTGVQDDTVRSVENLLLTTTNIGRQGGVFDLATRTVLDMAQAMGGDTKAATIELSKALNDPIAGISALKRVNVDFTEEQKKQIKAMQDAGDMAGAQGVVLAELQREFGGSAEAAGKANGGIKILAAQFDNMKQSIGQALIPVLVTLMQIAQPVLGVLGSLMPAALGLVQGALSAVQPALKELHGWFEKVEPLLQITWTYLGYVAQAIGDALTGALSALLGPFGEAHNRASMFHNILTFLSGLIPQVNGFLFNLQSSISANTGPFAALHAVAQMLGNFFWNTLIPAIRGLAGFVVAEVLPAIGNFATFVATQVIPTIEKLATWFETKVLPAIVKFAGFVATDVVPVIIKLAGWVEQNLIPIVKTLAEVFVNNILPALESVWTSISSNLLPALQRLWDKISPILTPALQAIGWVLQNVVGPALQVVISFVSNLIDVISTVIDKIGGLLGKLGDMKDAVGGALSHLPHFATGGVTLGGSFVGAENGPELLMKPGVYSAPPGSMIFNAQDTRKLLGSGGAGGMGGGGVTNNYNIYPAKAQFGPEELDTLQRRYALLGNTGGGY